MTLEVLAAAVGWTPPSEYVVFLDGLEDRPTILLDFGGRMWRPFDRRRLAETMPGLKRDHPVPYAHWMARVASDLRGAVERHGDEMTAALEEQGFTLDRMARSFCIGDDGNANPVFVDHTTGAVYAYYPDGMDVERWAESPFELIFGSHAISIDDGDEPQ